MSAVAPPMISSVTRNAYLRPTRSPMRPKNERAERAHDEADRERREVGDQRERVVALADRTAAR